MAPFGGEQDREIILFQQPGQLIDGIGPGITRIGLLRRLDGILKRGPHLLLPFDFHGAEQIGELAGGPFPQTGGRIGKIGVPSHRGRAFPRFALFALHPEHDIVGFRLLRNNRIAQPG